ncbi:response regulator [Telluribacter sp.]|jgi:signal transduction histidine kinase/CheY-like chemotaxis protein|uniref:response regulator n=1 Tax=Telluribacter sp. TaxID=1978767 RepID=UPI002E15D033|nr:response regulator [Telluribacter sp.]
MLTLSFILGYPITSLLFLISNSPYVSEVLTIQLLTSAILTVLLLLNFKNKISNVNLALYCILVASVFHAYLLWSIPHKTYERETFNIILVLLFTLLIVRWNFRYALIAAIVPLILFPTAVYLHNPASFPKFLGEGGLFMLGAYLVYPYLSRMRFEKDKKEFYLRHTLQKQNEALEKQKTIAEQATRAKSEFLSMMSHEIRTPLNGIVGVVHLMLQDGKKNDFQADLVQTLKFSADHLMAVVNDILDFNKINSNHVQLDPIPFEVRTLLKNLEKTFIPKAAEKKLDLLFKIDTDIPTQIVGDKVRLNQILNNLIHNAIKFTEKGSVKLVVKVINKDERKVRLHFMIIDTGIGIPYEQQPAIFESFTQASVATHRQYGGTGLGLAISKELLQLFGSEIQLFSEVGRGSSFTFSIDFPYLEEQPVQETLAQVEATDTFSHARVLVVDDNPINLLVATNFLKRRGIQFETAVNGLDAIEKFKATSYDLILMDLRMPEMDGFDATRTIRTLDRSIPVIALTASAFSNEKERAMASGFTAYLTKPFLPKDFYDTILPRLSRETSDSSSRVE